MTAVIYTETDFLSRDLLIPYKDEMVEHYFQKAKEKPTDYSFLYSNNLIETNIIPRIKEVLNKSFKINATAADILCNIYVQNNEYCKPYFHHHMDCEPNLIDASLTATLYLDPPKVGGEFQFMPRLIDPETFEDDLKDLKEHTFKVEENKLYFFPSWWMHRPLPQEDKTYRVCLSFNIYSFDRPEFLPGKVIW